MSELFRTEFFNKLVGVFGILKLEELDLHPHVTEDAHGAIGRAAACLVHIVGDDHLFGVTRHHARLLFRESST